MAKKLVINDAKIKKAYEARQANGINKKELIEIIRTAKDSDGGHYKKSISKDEAADIRRIVKHGKVTKAAKEFFADYMVKKSQRHSTRPITDPKTLQHIVAALRSSRNTTEIFFTSPTFPITYRPGNYAVVARAIEDGYIEVWEMEMQDHLMAVAGMSYSSDLNRLNIPKGSQPGSAAWDALLVHEATHAIQDLADVSMVVQAYEADAYIAQTVCMLYRRQEAKLSKFLKNFAPAARLVLDDKPLKGTGGPVPEYKAAMKAVAEHPLYQEKAKKEKSFDESIFQEAIEGLFADHAESEYQSKLGKPVSAAH